MADFPLLILSQHGVLLDDEALHRLNTYGNLLLEWNEKINLTAITDPRDIVVKHFLDSLMVFKAADVPQGATLIDVGTGAGFPGMVLKIARPDLKVTLLDGLNKRLIFLGDVAAKTGLDVEILHLRAEEGGRNAKLRDSFDFAVARAVAPLNILLEYCAPFVTVGGSFIAMKGPAAQQELENSAAATAALGVAAPNVTEVSLTGDEKRFLINYKKISQTSPKYPRISAKISKMPL